MVNRFAVQPEIPDLHQDGNLFVDESLDATLQLVGANFYRLMAFLAFGSFNGMPEVDRQTQEDDGHLKGEQNFLCLHDWVGRAFALEGEATIPNLNLSNQTSLTAK